MGPWQMSSQSVREEAARLRAIADPTAEQLRDLADVLREQADRMGPREAGEPTSCARCGSDARFPWKPEGWWCRACGKVSADGRPTGVDVREAWRALDAVYREGLTDAAAPIARLLVTLGASCPAGDVGEHPPSADARRQRWLRRNAQRVWAAFAEADAHLQGSTCGCCAEKRALLAEYLNIK